MPRGEGSYELTSEFRNTKRDLDRDLHNYLKQDLDSINRDFPRGHSQQAVTIEDACCSHLARTAKKYWEELLEPAPLSPQRRSQLFRRAIDEAFREIGACARKSGGHEAVKSYRDHLMQSIPGSQADIPVDWSPQAKLAPGAHQSEPAAAKVHPLTWKEVEISFFNEHSVQITAGEKKGIHGFGELGMSQKRSGKSTRAWQMLHFLALSKGTLSHPAAREVQWKTVEKRMQELRKWLRKRFDISSDPLPYVKGSGYSAEFRINCAASYQK